LTLFDLKQQKGLEQSRKKRKQSSKSHIQKKAFKKTLKIEN